MSLWLSLVVEGTAVYPREPWIVAFEHECQSPVSFRPPRNTPGGKFSPVVMEVAGGKGRCAMEVVHPRCAGIDISKRDAKVCVRIQGEGGHRTSSTVTTWGAMTNQVLALRDHLAGAQVTVVVMEATGDYWRPFYYLLEAEFQVMLVNAHSVRNVPGRKTDLLTELAGRIPWACRPLPVGVARLRVHGQ